MATEDTHKFEDRSLKKIYAISSVDGHVMYHIADGKKKPRAFSFSRNQSNPSNEVVNLATSLIDDKQIVTQKNHDFKIIDPNYNTYQQKNNMKVFVNPLGFKESNSDKSSIDSYSTSESTSVENTSDDKNDRDSGFIYDNDDFELTNVVRKEVDDSKKSEIVAKPVNFSPSKKVTAYLEQMENISGK